jgi:hypothetical protein
MRWQLVWPVLATVLLPLLVSWWVYPTHLPPGFGEFPPQYVATAPGFNLWYFLAVSVGVVWISLMMFWPAKMGFKGATPAPAIPTQPLPWWFYAGLVVTGFFWWLMWSHSMAFGNLVYWSFTPLWWGFIFVLDGVL